MTDIVVAVERVDDEGVAIPPSTLPFGTRLVGITHHEHREGGVEAGILVFGYPQRKYVEGCADPEKREGDWPYTVMTPYMAYTYESLEELCKWWGYAQ